MQIPEEDAALASHAAFTMTTSFRPVDGDLEQWNSQRNTLSIFLPPQAHRVLEKYMPALAASSWVQYKILGGLSFILAAFKGASLGQNVAVDVHFYPDGPGLSLLFHGSRCTVYPRSGEVSAMSDYLVKDVETPALLCIANLGIQLVLEICFRAIAQSRFDPDVREDFSEFGCTSLKVSRNPEDQPLNIYLIMNEKDKCCGYVRSNATLSGAESLYLEDPTLHLREVSLHGPEGMVWLMGPVVDSGQAIMDF